MYEKITEDISDLNNIRRYDNKIEHELKKNNNIENVSLQVKNFNDTLRSYLDIRNTQDENDIDDLDRQLLIAYNSNQNAMVELIQHQIDRFENVQELVDNIKDSEKDSDSSLEILKNEDDGEIQFLKNELQKKKEEEEIEKRKLEINTYNYKKYYHYQTILKKIIFLFGIILFFSLLFKSEFIDETSYILIVGIIIVIICTLSVYEIADVSMRDPRNYDEYNFNSINKKRIEMNEDKDEEIEITEFCNSKK